jgi:hypothetical protein
VVIACVLVALFLFSIRKYYHPGTGFTALIGLPAGHEYETAAMRAVPHYDYAGAGVYDGQFYAQRALDPLARDPLTDRAMDLAPFRARRILFSWTAYLAGFGQPAWILEAYALQNVVCWLLLAALLARWLPPSTPRGLAAWGACLFSHGLLWSVRFALLDGPSLLLIALAIKLSEDGRAWASAAVAGVSGLGRETNLLAALAQPLPAGVRAWVRLVPIAVIVVLPLLVWEDYLYSIYRSTIFAGAEGQATTPGVALAGALSAAWAHVRSAGVLSPAASDACILGSLVVQAVYLAVHLRHREAWWRVGAGYVVLLLIMDRVLVTPSTGAITRVMLPMTAAFNVLLVRSPGGRGFWAWFLAGNLHLVPGLRVL